MTVDRLETTGTSSSQTALNPRYSLCRWGNSLTSRLTPQAHKNSSEESRFTSNVRSQEMVCVCIFTTFELSVESRVED